MATRTSSDPPDAPAAGRIATRGLVPPVMAQQFSTLQPVWVEAHLRLLCALRQQFGSDLDKPIILGIIGQRHFATVVQQPYDYAHALAGDVPLDMARLTNIESIAEATGIPRETVRRKVNDLIALGWVAKGRRGTLAVTPAATEALTDATEASYALLDATFEALANALVDAGHLAIEVRGHRPPD